MSQPIESFIEVKDHGFEVLHAPDEAEMSLALLVAADPRIVRLQGRALLIGRERIRYRIVDYNDERLTFHLERMDCSECGAELPSHGGTCSRWKVNPCICPTYPCPAYLHGPFTQTAAEPNSADDAGTDAPLRACSIDIGPHKPHDYHHLAKPYRCPGWLDGADEPADDVSGDKAHTGDAAEPQRKGLDTPAGSVASPDTASPDSELAGFNFDRDRARGLVTKMQCDLDSSEGEYDQDDSYVVDFDEVSDLLRVASVGLNALPADTASASPSKTPISDAVEAVGTLLSATRLTVTSLDIVRVIRAAGWGPMRPSSSAGYGPHEHVWVCPCGWIAPPGADIPTLLAHKPDCPSWNRHYTEHPAERAIQLAVDRVEEMGAHPDLTAIVVALGKLRDQVAAYPSNVDAQPQPGTPEHDRLIHQHPDDCDCYDCGQGEQF